MKKNIFSISIALLIFLCFLYGFQKKQKPPEQLEYEVTVELVVVEVFVTDKEGNFVDNLTRDDFEIYEDGKKVEIYYFDIVRPKKEIIIEPQKEVVKEEIREKIPEKKKPLPPPKPPQKMKLVILFDNFNNNRFYLNAQWPKMVEMFKSLSDKVEEIMVIELNRESGMRIIQPFTSDKDLLASKISKLRFDMWKEIERDMRKREIEELIIEGIAQDLGTTMGKAIGNPEYVIRCLQEEERYMMRIRLADSLSNFLAAVNYIRKFEGIKSVLIVSDGFHLERKIKIGSRWETDVKKDIVRIFDPFKLFGGKKYFDQQEAFEKFLQLINEEKLIFYAFSPKGLREEFSVRLPFTKKFSDEMELWSTELQTIHEIADETGGVYLGGEKKYENFVKELGRDLNYFYDISYIPPKRKKRGEYHKIEVKLKRPGLIVRYKKGYSDFTERDIEKKNIASAFLSPSFFKDISFSCKTDFLFLRGGYPQFWIRLKLPLDQFKSDRVVSPPEKLALMFGINEWEENRVHLGGRVLRVKEAVEKGLDSLYRAFITSIVKLKPGEYVARIILRQSGDQIGGWEAPIKIPDMKKSFTSSIVNNVFGFLKAEERENTVPFSVSIGDGSLLLSRFRLYPFVGNVFKKGRKVALFLQIYSPREIKDFPLQFYLCRDENKILNLPYEKIESQFDNESKISNEVYLLDFDEIPPGDYQLEIEASDYQVEKRVKIKVIS